MAKTHEEKLNYLKEVREQYESYPYPPRNPDDEAKHTISTLAESLEEINYFYFGGKRDFSEGFRVLVAGGGTGDSTIFLAHQLQQYSKAEVIYLDITQASMKVAQERARVKGLKNISWHHGSLLDLGGKLNLGEFDYISCSGVLHHLEDPNAGIRALASVLKKDGAMNIMLYATYGRMDVYHMQSLMRKINRDEENMQTKVDNCKKVLQSLPPMNWQKVATKGIKNDVDMFGDVGIYDLYLHSHDRPYTVEDVYEFAQQADLEVDKFFYPNSVYGNASYDVKTYVRDPELLAKLDNCSRKEKQAIAEMMHSRIRKHNFSLRHNVKTVDDYLTVYEKEAVPVRNRWLLNEHAWSTILEIFTKGKPLNLTMQFGTFQMFFHTTPVLTRAMELIDNKRSLRQIYQEATEGLSDSAAQISYKEFAEQFEPVFKQLENYHFMTLIHQSVVK